MRPRVEAGEKVSSAKTSALGADRAYVLHPRIINTGAYLPKVGIYSIFGTDRKKNYTERTKK